MKSLKKQEFTVKIACHIILEMGIHFYFPLTKFIDSAKKLKRPLKEMPLSHLRKVITSLFLKNIQKSTQVSAANGLCYLQPGANIKLFCSLFAVTFLFLEKNYLSPPVKQYPFCNFRAIFLSPLLPKED